MPPELRLRCRLVRGRFDGHNRSVGHAWNLVWSPKPSGWHLIDVMHNPSLALEEDSEQAQTYTPGAVEQAPRRAGAPSTPSR